MSDSDVENTVPNGEISESPAVNESNPPAIITDVAGNPMMDTTDPHALILNNHKINYHLLAHGMGVAERHGRRDTQEDRVVTFVEPLLTSGANVEKILKKTIKSLEQQVENMPPVAGHDYNIGYLQGSCLLTTITIGNTIYLANVGDSEALLVTIDAHGQTQVSRLNTLHHPSNAAEKKRIRAAGGKIYQNRLNGLLAVSRAIGDTEFGEHISHQPELVKKVIDMPAIAKAFLITACDGLTESLNNLRILGLMENNSDLSAEQIAARLAAEAENQGSYDNISVIVTPIDPDNLTPRVACVFDGHGGSDVAEMLYQQFQPTFEKILQFGSADTIEKSVWDQYPNLKIAGIVVGEILLSAAIAAAFVFSGGLAAVPASTILVGSIATQLSAMGALAATGILATGLAAMTVVTYGLMAGLKKAAGMFVQKPSPNHSLPDTVQSGVSTTTIAKGLGVASHQLVSANDSTSENVESLVSNSGVLTLQEIPDDDPRLLEQTSVSARP